MSQLQQPWEKILIWHSKLLLNVINLIFLEILGVVDP